MNTGIQARPADAPSPQGGGWWAFTALAVATLAYQISEQGTEYASVLPIAALITCAAGRVLHQVWRWHAPAWAIVLAVVGVIAHAALSTLQHSFQVAAFANFMIMLGAIKCFEPRTARDDGQLLIVSMFMILSAAVGSNEFVPGLLTFIYLFLVVVAAMRVQIDAVSDPAPRAGRLLRTLPLHSMVGVVIIGSVVFMLLPRELGEVLAARGRPTEQRVTGFRETVELGRSGLISQDSREVMSIRARTILDGESVEVGGGVLRLRGRSLDSYSNGRWFRVAPQNWEVDASEVMANTGRVIDPAGMRVQNSRIIETVITQFGGASQNDTIFALWKPVKVDIARGRGDLRRDLRDDSLRLEQDGGGRSEYVVRSILPTGLPEPRETRVQLLDVVPEEVTHAAWDVLRAQEIEPDPALRDPADDPFAMSALASWLSTSKSYTLDIEPAPSDIDPTVWFIQTAEAGHCEYFASSLAMMARAVGIRSRVVTGYLLSEFDEQTGAYRVRRSHAHAWVEAEVGDNVWREYDATPAGSLDAALQTAVNPFVRWLSSLESAWLSSFVSFDSRNQRAFAGRFSEAMQRVNPLGDRLSTGRPALSFVEWLGLISLAAPVGVVVFLILARRARRRSNFLPVDVQQAVSLLTTYWRSRGMPREPGSTLSAQARRTGPSEAVDLAEAIEGVLFGGRSQSQLGFPQLKEASVRFETAIEASDKQR